MYNAHSVTRGAVVMCGKQWAHQSHFGTLWALQEYIYSMIAIEFGGRHKHILDIFKTIADHTLVFQAQLRAFIPEMLKYSTGRGKPGWGKESCKPIWWPEDIPWANVRSDVRTEEQKQRVSVPLA